jgi:membrane fusion protein (multidrug efflux system)
VTVSTTTLRNSGMAASLLTLAAMLYGCNAGQAETSVVAQEPELAPLPVEVVLPAKTEIVATYHATTTLASDADAPVLARVPGEVVEILVEEGDRVAEGQVLARLDGERLRLELNVARANLEKAEREYLRMVNLHERGLISSSAFDGLKFGVDELRAGFELKKLAFEYTDIRAPIAGVVSTRDVKLGQHLGEGDAAFRVTDTSQLVAHLKIPQSELARINAGDAAEIRVDAIPTQTFAARIARISPTIDARNGTFRATAYVDNESGHLAPGMFGRFEIAFEKHEDALTVPSNAVVAEDDQNVIYIVSDGAAVRRVVSVGIENDGYVEILNGIGETDQVVITGLGGLRDGSRVLASAPILVSATG